MLCVVCGADVVARFCQPVGRPFGTNRLTNSHRYYDSQILIHSDTRGAALTHDNWLFISLIESKTIQHGELVSARFPNACQIIILDSVRLSYAYVCVVVLQRGSLQPALSQSLSRNSSRVSCILYLVSCILYLEAECEADAGAAAHRSVSHASLWQVFTYTLCICV